MSRLLVHVEGQTEETFVNELLCPQLTRFGWSMVSARLLGNAHRRDRRGGIKKPLWGPLAALEIGLGTMRRECPHFGSWLDRLEQLPNTGA